eukprot:scaffold15775_cov60-Phaeocystis_antarctica.AAC.2
MQSLTCRQDPKLVSGAKCPDRLQVYIDSWFDHEPPYNGNKKRSARELRSVEQVRWGVAEPSTIHTCDL